MNRDVIISKHIHSGCASFQSGDEFARVVTAEFRLDFSLPKVKGKKIFEKHQAILIRSTEFPMLDLEYITEINSDSKCIMIYVRSDETFSDVAVSAARRSGKSFLTMGSMADTAEFKEHLDKLRKKGWKIDDEKVPARDAFYAREEVRWEKMMKKTGHVLWKRYEHLTAADFKGGFSDEVMNSPIMKDYIREGKSVHGYIGHRCRQFETDKIIEAGLRERGLSPAAMVYWLYSGDGRHFGDSIEGGTVEENSKVVKRYLNSIFNYCLISSHEKHDGSRESAEEIRQILKEKGLLLPEDNEAYDKSGWMKMMAAFLAVDAKVSGKELPAHIEKALPGIMEELKHGKKKPDIEVGN